MGGWFGGGKAVEVPGPVTKADPVDAQAASPTAKAGTPLGSRQTSRLAGRAGQTAFGGKAGDQAASLGQGQYANMARKALLGE